MGRADLAEAVQAAAAGRPAGWFDDLWPAQTLRGRSGARPPTAGCACPRKLGRKERRWLRAKAAWDQVGEDFKALGRQVKQHYDRRPRPEGGQGREGPAPSADRRKVDEALEARGVAGAGVRALGDAVHRAQVGEQTKEGRRVADDALTATFAEASERFRKK